MTLLFSCFFLQPQGYDEKMAAVKKHKMTKTLKSVVIFPVTYSCFWIKTRTRTWWYYIAMQNHQIFIGKNICNRGHVITIFSIATFNHQYRVILKQLKSDASGPLIQHVICHILKSPIQSWGILHCHIAMFGCRRVPFEC